MVARQVQVTFCAVYHLSPFNSFACLPDLVHIFTLFLQFSLNRLVVHLLEVVDGCFSTFVSQEEMPRQSALDAATSLMTSAMPSVVQHQAQALLATLHPSKMSYHSHKVCRLTWYWISLTVCFQDTNTGNYCYIGNVTSVGKVEEVKDHVTSARKL